MQAAPPPPAQPQPAAPGTQAPESAPTSAPPSPGSPIFMFVMLFGILALFMWQSRSQQKKQAAIVGALKKGDRVTTQSGLVGRLVEKDARYAKLEIAPNVKVQVLTSSLAGRDSEPAPSAKKDESSSASN